jgi:uncharacterized protein (TIGR03084 family)
MSGTAVSAGDLADDLAVESVRLLDIVTPLDDHGWASPTPADGWSIQDQVNHLAYFDDAAAFALTDPVAFRRSALELVQRSPNFPDVLVQDSRGLAARDTLIWFRRSRQALLAAFRSCDTSGRVPWYGPDMSVKSSITARLMETWAHGQDIRDARGVAEDSPVNTLRHVADLGVRTRAFSYALRRLPPPERAVRVELTAPDGSTWTWGPEGAGDLVRGAARDFCLVVTQRRHLSDTNLATSGSEAARWMEIAQAFAGEPGPGRLSSRE